MPYLHRRIEHLLELIKTGKLYFPIDLKDEDKRQLEEDIKRIRRDKTGMIDLGTCSPKLIFLAKALYILKNQQPGEKKDIISSENPVSDIIQIQRNYFNILEQFFIQATGKTPEDFATPDTFGSAIHKDAEKLAKLLYKAFPKGYDSLTAFYDKHKTSLYSLGRESGGIKLVLGGSQRLFYSTPQCIQSMLLYSDSIFIPDPVLPWIETQRDEEKFRDIHMLEAVFLLLQLKPLVDAELPWPSIVVFPSWEKSLESQDTETQDQLGRFIIDFFSFHFERQFDDESQIIEFARTNESDVLSTIDAKRLFLGPEGKEKEPLKTQLKRYKESIAKWRSKDYVKQMEGHNDAELACLGIFERLEPQHHLRDNSESLLAQPLLTSHAHWYYYKLCTTTYNDTLLQSSILKPETVATIIALSMERFSWLGKVPLEHLIQLRQENASIQFRERLRQFTQELHEARLEDIDEVSTQITHGLHSLLLDHQKNIAEIESEFGKRHKVTMEKSWITLAATFLPWLAPFLELIPVGYLSYKYIKDKVEEIKAKKQASRSLTGVLSAVYEK